MMETRSFHQAEKSRKTDGNLPNQASENQEAYELLVTESKSESLAVDEPGGFKPQTAPSNGAKAQEPFYILPSGKAVASRSLFKDVSGAVPTPSDLAQATNERLYREWVGESTVHPRSSI